jgi:hypothetical protein
VHDKQTDKIVRKESFNMTAEEEMFFDPSHEYDRLVAEDGEKMNARDKKNLKKKLKNKSKKLKKKYGDLYRPGEGTKVEEVKPMTPKKKK